MQVFQDGETWYAADVNTLPQTCDTLDQLTSFVGATGIQVSVRGAAAPGDGGGGDFWWSASSTATSDGVNVINPAGHTGAGRWLRLVESAPNSYVPAGLPFDGVSDAYPAIQAALNAGSPIYLPSNNGAAITYMLSAPLVIFSNSSMTGAGVELVSLKLMSGINADVIVGQNAYALFGSGSNAGIHDFVLQGFTIDGNRGSQSGTVNNINGLAVYGYHFILRDLYIYGCYGNGIRSEYGSGVSGAGDSVETAIYNVTIDTVGANGWLDGGPHDSVIDKLIVIDAGQLADNTYSGVSQYGSSTGVFSAFHGWHRSTSTNRVKYQFFSSGGNIIADSEFEGGRKQFCFNGNEDQVSNSTFYAPFGSNNDAMIDLFGNSNLMSNLIVKTSGGNGNNFYGMQIGKGGTPVSSNRISGYFEGFSANTPFNFVSDFGLNVISGSGFSAGGGATSFGGSPSGTDTIDYDQGGTVIHAHWHPNPLYIGYNSSHGPQVLQVAGAALFNINGSILTLGTTSATQQATIDVFDNGTRKWFFGKDTDNSFFLWDQAAGAAVFRAASNGDSVISPAGGNLKVGAVGFPSLIVSSTPNANTYVEIYGQASGNVPRVVGVGAALQVSGGTAQGVQLASDGASTTQFEAVHVASATRWLQVRGSNGGNPQIGASGGNLALGSIPILPSYTVGTLPSASAAGVIYVSDGTSNKRLAVADGTNWRWPDGVIVS